MINFISNINFPLKSNKIICPLFFNALYSSEKKTGKSSELSYSENFGVKPHKKKIVVTKKILSSDPTKPPKILEYVEAASWRKRYNYENSVLFGPIISSKKKPINAEKIEKSDEFIQHDTQLPVVDVQKNFQSQIKMEPTREIDLNTILEFPLLNKNCDGYKIKNKIIELNMLRKYLENKSCDQIPSVSSILEKTMSKESVESLNRWKKSMILKLGEEGFERYRKELLQTGSSLHAHINDYLADVPENKIHIEENNKGHWKSLKSVFPFISDVQLLEEKVSHPFLCYRGVVDCFGKYKNQLVVIDWKTSKKSKVAISSTFDNPLQIAAYVGALNFDPRFQYLANQGLIVIAYEKANPATAHFIDEEKMHHYWIEWLKRVKLFWELKDSSEN